MSKSLSELLADRSVDSRIAELLLEYARERTVEACDEDARKLPLSAAHDAYAAVYVGRSDLSIALEPQDARRLHERHGWRLEEKNPATSYVHMTPADLATADHRTAALATVGMAFDRAFQGPRWNRGLPDRRFAAQKFCERCGTLMPVAGGCDYCD